MGRHKHIFTMSNRILTFSCCPRSNQNPNISLLNHTYGLLLGYETTELNTDKLQSNLAGNQDHILGFSFISICPVSRRKECRFCSVWVTSDPSLAPFRISQFLLFFFLSLLYGMPAPSSESQPLEAWPASIYGPYN